MPPDAFRLVVRGNDLHLVGQNGRGVLYAVFALAERFGCRFFAHDTEVIPHPAELSLPDGLDVTEASPFAYRDLYWIGTTDPLTAVKLRINGTGLKSGQHIRHLTAEVGGGIGYAGPHFVHTFDLLLPPEKYFAEHPRILRADRRQTDCKAPVQSALPVQPRCPAHYDRGHPLVAP